jgi:VanZ family protein
MKLARYVGPLVAYAVYIFFAGSIKDSAPPGGMSDKTAHAIAFGLMVPLAVHAAAYVAPRLGFAARVFAAVAVASALGGLLEIWQLLLPWRTSEVLDWVADTLGAVAVGLAFFAFDAAAPRQRREKET